jgi:hypothetical protein
LPREIVVHGVRVELVGRLGLERVGAGPHERQIALHHIQELRQFIEARLAQEPAHRGHTGVAFGDEFRGLRVGRLREHGAELVDVDLLVVEAEALLPE